jgi:pimeloyl-ACP methyl ester carboxylesterase
VWPVRIKDTTETQRAMIKHNRISTVLEDLYADIPRLRTPGLILWGQDDKFLPLSTAERFSRESRSELVLVPNAGHMPYWQRPDEVATQVLQFLQPAATP